MRFLTILCFFITGQVCYSQQFPFIENFDGVTPPLLPAGWTTTTNRSTSGDFITTASIPFSDSNAVVSTNATVSQSLTSPRIDFSNRQADSLIFYERRSSSHNSGFIIEASIDDGISFTISVTDTLYNPGTTSYIERAFKLPETISNQADVRFRWRVIGNGTGTTGTLRLDNIMITAKAQIDVAVKSIQWIPLFPSAGDSVTVLSTIANPGIVPVQNIRVDFFLDLNNDSLPEENELFSSSTIDQLLNPGDTAGVGAMLANIPFGNNIIIVQASADGDENILNNIMWIILSAGWNKNAIVINEIMYAPNPGEPEWIELFNTTSSSIDLENWKISNRNGSTKYTMTDHSLSLNANGYIVITKDTALFRNVHPAFHYTIIQSSSLPTFLFNNNGDAVVLFDSRGSMMDSVHYSPIWGGKDGKSLERIEPTGSSTDSTNWGTSIDSLNSTPGRQNSLTPVEHDLRMNSILCLDEIHSCRITATVQNIGREPATNFSLELYDDRNEDSIPDPSELLQVQTVSAALQQKDSMTVPMIWNNAPSGRHHLIAVIHYPDDLRLSNNVMMLNIKISYPASSVVINEIMYAPLSGQAEYIELYNPTKIPIDLREWKLTDKPDTSRTSDIYTLTKNQFLLNPGAYITIASDSDIVNQFSYLRDTTMYRLIIKRSGISLNNSGDNVILYDLTGTTIDSVLYSSSWQNPNLGNTTGRSLEKINPTLDGTDSRNWGTSASPFGGTPGKQNSVFTNSIPANVSLSCAPNPFSPDGDGFQDVTIIQYSLPASLATIRIRIYDAMGRIVRTLADGEPAGAHGSVVWNGLSDRGERVRIGIYIILLETIVSNGMTVQTVKGTVVVATKL